MLNERLKLIVSMVVVAAAALALLSTSAPEFMASIQDPELMSMNPATSNFNASNGFLVTDDAPPSSVTDDTSTHAAGKAPTIERAASF